MIQQCGKVGLILFLFVLSQASALLTGYICAYFLGMYVEIAYYNAGSAALALLLIALAIGGFFYCRARNKRKSTLRGLPISTQEEEETIPLSQSVREGGIDNGSELDLNLRRTGSGSVKGKERERAGTGVGLGENGHGNGHGHGTETIFEVGDSDDEDYRDDRNGRRS